MLTKNAEFKLKLKNCKSLEDYRLLAEEYNMEKGKGCPKYREHIIRKSIRERASNLQIY